MKSLIVALATGVVAFVSQPEARAACGQIEVAKGSVSVQSGQAAAKPAAVGAKVCSGDTVIAGPDSRAKLKMEDGNELNISPDSKIAIETYQFEPAQNKKKVLLNVLQGKVRAATARENMYNDKSADGGENSFQVKTKSAVAGVRGTDFLTGYDPKTKKSEIVTFRGHVEFGTPGPGGRIMNPVQVSAGQTSTQTAGQAPAAPKPMPAKMLQQMNNESKAETGGSGSGAKNDAAGGGKNAAKGGESGGSKADAGGAGAANGNSAGSTKSESGASGSASSGVAGGAAAGASSGGSASNGGPASGPAAGSPPATDPAGGNTSGSSANAGSDKGGAPGGSMAGAANGSSGSSGGGSSASSGSGPAGGSMAGTSSRMPASAPIGGGMLTGGDLGIAPTSGASPILPPTGPALPPIPVAQPIAQLPVIPVCQQCLDAVQNSPAKLNVRVHLPGQ